MPEKSEMVAKSNRLVEASYRLSLNEQRMILYAISRCREEQKGLTSSSPVTITAIDFAKQFPGIDMSNAYRQLLEAMDNLFDRFVTVYDSHPESGEDRVTKTRWISAASYVDGAGCIQLIFTPMIIEYITRLETEFTRYQLDKIAGMSSAHAVRLYELLLQYRVAGKREFSLVDLRTMFQMEPTEYKLTADLKKWVIDVAVNQINEHSDLIVSYHVKKTGRAISHFAFKIKGKSSALDASAVAEDQVYRDKLEANGQQRLDQSTEAF